MAIMKADARAEMATRISLSSPDRDENMKLCALIKSNPWETKDALVVLKTRLVHYEPKIQQLCLSVLETLGENCGDQVFQLIVELRILDTMVEIVHNTTVLSVRDKVLVLIDAWQEAVGGSSGSVLQFSNAYQELKEAGVDFPPREESVRTTCNDPDVATSALIDAPHLSGPGSMTTGARSSSGPSTPDIRNWTGGSALIMRFKEYVLVTCNCFLLKRDLIEVDGEPKLKKELMEYHGFLHVLDQTSVCLFVGLSRLTDKWKDDFFSKIEKAKDTYEKSKRNPHKREEKIFMVEEYLEILESFRTESIVDIDCPKETVQAVLVSWNPNKSGDNKVLIYHLTNGKAKVVLENCYQVGGAFGSYIPALQDFSEEMKIGEAIKCAEEGMCQLYQNAPKFGLYVCYFGPTCKNPKKNKLKEREKRSNVIKTHISEGSLKHDFPKVHDIKSYYMGWNDKPK